MSAKRKVIYVPAEFVLELFKTRQHDVRVIPVFEGLPSDAVFVDVSYDFARGCFCFKVEHDSFEATTEGRAYPEIKVRYKTVVSPDKKE